MRRVRKVKPGSTIAPMKRTATTTTMPTAAALTRKEASLPRPFASPIRRFQERAMAEIPWDWGSRALTRA